MGSRRQTNWPNEVVKGDTFVDGEFEKRDVIHHENAGSLDGVELVIGMDDHFGHGIAPRVTFQLVAVG